MTTIEIVRELCKKEGISITTLEEKLGYSNGSLSKSSVRYLRSDRLYAISKYFNVSMEYLMGTDEITHDAKAQIITVPERKLSEQDDILLSAFDYADELTKQMVLRLLKIDEEKTTIRKNA